MLNGRYPRLALTESRRQSGVDNVGRGSRDWFGWAQVGAMEDDPGVTLARTYCHPNPTAAVQSYAVNADRISYCSLPKQTRQTPQPIGTPSLPPPRTMVCNSLYPDVTATVHTHEAIPATWPQRLSLAQRSPDSFSCAAAGPTRRGPVPSQHGPATACQFALRRKNDGRSRYSASVESSGTDERSAWPDRARPIAGSS